jgi:hypothetical protein
MEDIHVVTDRWAKMSEFFFTSQEDEQKYVPPSKRALLPTPSIDHSKFSPPEPVPPVQPISLEALLDQQYNKDTQKGEQH